MIKHIVLLSFKPTTSPEKVVEFSETAYNTLKVLPGVKNLFVGKAAALKGQPKYQCALIMEFRDGAAYNTYLEHPSHVKFATEVLPPLVAETLVADFE